eukprot:2411977-Rhodomonas_salina.2
MKLGPAPFPWPSQLLACCMVVCSSYVMCGIELPHGGTGCVFVGCGVLRQAEGARQGWMAESSMTLSPVPANAPATPCPVLSCCMGYQGSTRASIARYANCTSKALYALPVPGLAKPVHRSLSVLDIA